MAPKISDEAFQAVMTYRLGAMEKVSDKIEKTVDGLSWRMIKLEIRVYGIIFGSGGIGYLLFGGG